MHGLKRSLLLIGHFGPCLASSLHHVWNGLILRPISAHVLSCKEAIGRLGLLRLWHVTVRTGSDSSGTSYDWLERLGMSGSGGIDHVLALLILDLTGSLSFFLLLFSSSCCFFGHRRL